MRPLALQAGLGSVVSVSTCPILVLGNPRPAQAENTLGALFKFCPATSACDAAGLLKSTACSAEARNYILRRRGKPLHRLGSHIGTVASVSSPHFLNRVAPSA